MNRFERWFLKRLLKKLMRNKPWHDLHVRDVYSMVRRAAVEEFTEDNAPTTDDFLRREFERTQAVNKYNG